MRLKSPIAILGSWLALALASGHSTHAADSSPVAAAQPATPNPAGQAQSKATEEAVQLNAFEVKADADNSYGLQSNALTAFRLDLAKTPVTAQIFTQAFMDDIAATTIEDVLINYHGAISGATNTGTDAVTQEPGDRSGDSRHQHCGNCARPIHRPAPQRPLEHRAYAELSDRADRSPGRAAVDLVWRVERWRGRKYYDKRVIDALTCSVSAPSLLCRTASVSLTKCGHAEFGTPSSPPKRYLTKTFSGTLRVTLVSNEVDEFGAFVSCDGEVSC